MQGRGRVGRSSELIQEPPRGLLGTLSPFSSSLPRLLRIPGNQGSPRKILSLRPPSSVSLLEAAWGIRALSLEAASFLEVRTPIPPRPAPRASSDAALDSLAKFFHPNFIFFCLTSWGFLFVIVQSLSHVRLFATLGTEAGCSILHCLPLLKFMSIELVMLSTQAIYFFTLNFLSLSTPLLQISLFRRLYFNIFIFLDRSFSYFSIRKPQCPPPFFFSLL